VEFTLALEFTFSSQQEKDFPILFEFILSFKFQNH